MRRTDSETGRRVSSRTGGMGTMAAIALLWSMRDPAAAQSIAASLTSYQPALRVASVAGISAKSFSGVAFHPVTRTLYVIDNDNAIVYELDTAGVLRRSLATSGLTDPEGIAYQGDDYFLITEEGLANIVRLKLPRTGTGPVARSSGTVLNIGSNMSNSGIEGVGYRASDKTAFAVKETDPPRLYRIALDPAGAPSASAPDQPFSLGGKTGDAADIASLDDGNFIVVNQEEDRLEGYGPQGQALSTLKLGMAKPEGIAVDSASGTIFVVGEPMELAVFRMKSTAIGKPDRAGPGWASWVRRGAENGPAGAWLRLSLPRRGTTRIEYLGADGTHAEIFRGVLGPGEPVLRLAPPRHGTGFYRVSAGHRVAAVTLTAP